MQILFILLFQWCAHSLTDNAFSLGIGYYSENSFSRITKEDSGAKSFLGQTSYPLIFKYNYMVYTNGMSSYFLAPRLTYTLLPRTEDGSAAKVTLAHLMLPFGMNFGSSSWDWNAGPGILFRSFKGKGGLVQLNNGTGSATFAYPGGSSNSTLITLNAGTTYNIGAHAIGLDLITEGVLSDKRSLSLMLSYCYQLNGGSSYTSQRSYSPQRSSSSGGRL